ncbi:maleylpyruvate isomerase family mycothiol-dependent enzyme [Yinghuangia sp. YIM S09857]|uniref:maleylpyruvate isomerase family mycothiol-dependent enzyme n=1 Tax=Yinghuangia sp. YIM S09857 TaxID=3436929 RepID=UPI003F534B63
MAVTTLTQRRLLRTHSELVVESDAAFRLIDSLDELEWQAPTAVPGWMVRDHIAHLARFDEAARVALTDSCAFRRLAELDQAVQPWFPGHLRQQTKHLTSEQIADWFHRARDALLDAYRSARVEALIPWYGSDVAPEIAVALRLMETWVHLRDIGDALGERPESVRHLHQAPQEFADTSCFALPHIPLTDRGIRVDLVTPSGDRWSWGPTSSTDVVCGSALDFSLVISGRRHAHEVGLAVEGAAARALCGLG